MRTLAAAALIAIAWTSPAAAQIWGGTNMGMSRAPSRPSFDRDLARAGRDIDTARHNGQLTRSEARALRRDQRMIGTLQRRYANGGLTDAERAELATRIALLRDDTNARRLGTRK